jgi:DNA-binding beta-propeller fold protein YncE
VVFRLLVTGVLTVTLVLIISGPHFHDLWTQIARADFNFEAVGDWGCNSNTNRTVTNIQKFTNDGKFIRKWGSLGSGDGQFNNESLGIGTDSKGNVFVADTLNGRIQKFTNTGNFVKKWDLHGSHGPIDVAVDPSGNVFVTANNIQKFTNNGKFIREWGREGSGNGQFDNPYGIAIDPNGYDL